MADLLWSLEEVRLKGDNADRLKNVSIDVMVGVTAVVGHSGAGKTSLLNLLAGLEKPDAGQLTFVARQADSSAFSLPLFWVPQDGGLWPHMTARQQLTAVTASEDRGLKPVDDGESGNPIDKLLNDFDLLHRGTAFPSELSKGEQSRLSVARCLLANPAVMLMDEPFAHVDPERRPKYWAIVRQHLETRAASLVFATHSPDDAMRESQYVIRPDGGRVIFAGQTTEFYADKS